MPSASDLLRTASDGFREVVDSVTPADWDRPTPCDDWTVRELIGHVVSSSQMTAALADGASRDEAIGLLATDYVQDDPAGAVDAALTAQTAALTQDGIDTVTISHPAGDMPGSRVVGLRIADLLVHRWDLARAIGADESMPADVVQQVWDDTSPMAPIIAQLGVFGDGPSDSMADDAPLSERLLDLMGRRPGADVTH